MLEIKVTIEAAELAAAIDHLARAIEGRPIQFQSLEAETEKAAEPAAQPQQAVVPEVQAAPVPQPALNPPEPIPTPAAPVQVPTPVAPAPTPTPAAPVPTLDLDTLSRAGAGVISQSQEGMQKVLGLLKIFGVDAITQLREDQYPAFADELRKLGANI